MGELTMARMLAMPMAGTIALFLHEFGMLPGAIFRVHGQARTAASCFDWVALVLPGLLVQVTGLPRHIRHGSRNRTSYNALMPRYLAALVSLGCAKNLHDSEDLLTTLRGHGFALTGDLDQADLILLNTCSFIGDARAESEEAIREALSRRRPGCRVYVAGCLAQRYRAVLPGSMPAVDRWLVFADYRRLGALLRHDFPDAHRRRLPPAKRSQLTPPHYAYLKIAEGCDNACSFCAIPQIRGPHRSRPLEHLVRQAGILARRGVLEMVLVAQQLDDYGKDLYGRRLLCELLRRLADVAPATWIRPLYCYPNHCSAALIDALASRPNLLHYLDMPIQHASDRMLRLMGRRITQARIRDRLEALRRAMPDMALRTTILVGHPGETEADFQELLAFLAEIPFDQVGCFAYSPEEGTRSAVMADQVPAPVAEERLHQVMTRQRDLHHRRLRRWLGKRLEVVVDGMNDDGRFSCRHYGQAPEVDSVTLVRGQMTVGTRQTVRITGREGYDLTAATAVPTRAWPGQETVAPT